MSQQEEVPELLGVVAGNLVSVEEGLAALDTHRNTLHTHADAAKSEISSAVERQLSQLRAREKYLLRQVELATTHQNSEVNVTQAQLLQHKGALSVTRTILDNCNSCSKTSLEMESDSVPAVKSSIATTIHSMPHQDVESLLEHTEKLVRVPLVSVTVNESDLSTAIQSFGKVGLPITISHTSDLLPHSIEEYGDADHHVLHKSVQPEITSPSPINVRKPYLLAAKNFPPRKRAALPNARDSVSQKDELVKWLHRLQLESLNDSTCSIEDVCCGGIDVCVEEACQANEACQSFSNCLMSGQCKKSAEEKVQQSNMWHLKQLSANSPVSRKRHCSENNEPAKQVLNHMANILSSENGNWLIGAKRVGETNKRMKTNNLETSTPIKKCSDTRAAILYQPPQSSWVLNPSCLPQVNHKPIANHPSESDMNEMEVNKNVSSWLLTGKESQLFVNNKKANCEKENTLYRAGLIKSKSQLSLNSFGSIENVKDKIEKLTIDSSFKKPWDKEQWLLQQCASIKADNKILEEVMSKKCEWLSNSSINSFSIISEPGVSSCNSWLLTQ